MPGFGPVVQSLATLSVLALFLGTALVLLLVLPGGRSGSADRTAGTERVLLAFAWVVAAVATAGSLYLSDVAGLAPCLLCWYQRIGMYPLVPILGVAVLTGDGRVWRYALPLSLGGLLVSAYHVTIQYRPALDVVTCAADAPCTVRYLNVFGFVSIPVMAGSAFLLISGILVVVGLAAAADRGNTTGQGG